MSSSFLDDDLRDREVDPLVRSALLRVDRPDYVIRELVQSPDGLAKIMNRMSDYAGQNGTPPTEVGIAGIVTDLIDERQEQAEQADGSKEPPAPPPVHKQSMFPHLSDRFPKPIVISRFFRRSRRDTPAPNAKGPLRFEDATVNIDADASTKDAFLLRVQGVLARRRAGTISRDQATQEVTEAVVRLINRRG